MTENTEIPVVAESTQESAAQPSKPWLWRCLVVALVALGAAIVGFLAWRSRATEVVTLWDRPEFARVDAGSERWGHGVSFRVEISATKAGYKGKVYESLESLGEAVVTEIQKNKLTPDEITRTPVCVFTFGGRVSYDRVVTVLSMFARLGFKMIAIPEAYGRNHPAPADAPITLPVVTYGTPVELDATRPRNWIVVDVHRNGQIYVNDKGPLTVSDNGLSPSSFSRRIVEAVEPLDKSQEIPLLIRADEQVPVTLLRRIITTSCRNHLWDFYFLSKLPDGRTCIVARVEEPSPDGDWRGCDEEPLDDSWILPSRPEIRTARVGEAVWSYVLEEDGTARIWGGRNPDAWASDLCAVNPRPAGDLVIPAVLGGHSVSAVGDSALRACDLTSVQFPPRESKRSGALPLLVAGILHRSRCQNLFFV